MNSYRLIGDTSISFSGDFLESIAVMRNLVDLNALNSRLTGNLTDLTLLTKLERV